MNTRKHKKNEHKKTQENREKPVNDMKAELSLQF